MNPRGLGKVVACLVAAAATIPQAIDAQHAVRQAIDGRPDAIIDLRSGPGVELVRGDWRYSDARIVDVQSRAAGADLRASGEPVKALDVVPQAGSRDFDDSSWQRIVPASLEARRTNGRLSFNWYRIKITVPERINGFDPTGSTLVFATSLDDYAEIWIDSEIPRAAGQSGGSGGPPGSVEVAIPWTAFGCADCPAGFAPGVPFRFAMTVARGNLGGARFTFTLPAHDEEDNADR